MKPTTQTIIAGIGVILALISYFGLPTLVPGVVLIGIAVCLP